VVRPGHGKGRRGAGLRGRAVLFDLDGTLHDRDAGLAAFVARQHADLGLDALGVPVGAWTRRFVELDRGGRVWKDAVYARLCEEFALAHDPRDLLARYVEGFAAHAVPSPGLRPTLAALRAAGYRVGIVTNGRGLFQRATLAALGVDDLLDAVVVSEECGLRKPQAEIFDLALERCGGRRDGSWFVGDDPEADVRGAEGAGLRAVLFDPRRTEPAMRPRIESLDELLGLVTSSPF
jgi:putative hydrolase of the HAD superfamily